MLSLAIGNVAVMSADCTTMPSGAIAWWPGEDNANDVVNGNNGLLIGHIGYESGFVGQAISFDGDSSISIPYSASFNIGATGKGLTLEGWIKPSVSNRGMPIVEWGSFSNIGMHLWVEAGNRLLANVLDTTGKSHILLSADGAVSINSFQHVALTYDKAKGVAVLYLDGRQVAVKNIGIVTPQTSYSLNLGLRATSGEKYHGLLDELSFFDRALDTNEIAAICAAGRAGKCAPSCTPPAAGLVGWWPGEGNASDITGANNGAALGSFTKGAVGQGFSMNGVSGAVRIPASPSLNVGLADGMTVEAWIYPSNTSSQSIFEWSQDMKPGNYESGLTRGHPFYSTCNLYGYFFDANNAIHELFSFGPISSGVFEHVAMTYDKRSGMGRLFINGNLVDQQVLGSFTPKTMDNLFLGERPPGDPQSQVFDGIIDEAAVYNRALSTNEIMAIFMAGSAGKCVSHLPPVISTQPVSQTTAAAGNASLFVEVNGTGPFTYQWKFDGSNITSATTAGLTLNNLHASQTGNYSVTVTSPYGTTTSVPALLTVIAQSILIYNYSGSEKVTAAGNELSYGYSGIMYFLPAATNFVFIGWGKINGRLEYWVSPVLDYWLLSIPGGAQHSYTIIGKVATEFDAGNSPHLWSYLHKGLNTDLSIGTQKTFSFPNTFICNDTHVYPDNAGNLTWREANSSYTFAQPETLLANDRDRTLTDLLGAVAKNLTKQGYQLQQ